MAAGVNGHKPNMMQRLAEMFRPPTETIVSELIGRVVLGSNRLTRSRWKVKSFDETIPDYEFWDKLRRGKAAGYSLGGLFSGRIEQIFVSWTLGRGVDVTLAKTGDPDNEADPRNVTDGLLADFLNGNHSLLMAVEKDKLGLGDQYIIVNADGSLSVPSPDTVAVERDPLDYRRVIAVEVETKTDKYIVTDRYEPAVRIVTIKEKTTQQEQVLTFQNLLGRIPVVHLAHGMSGNEVYGHPIHEELRPLYDQYDDLIYKQLDGAKLLGNPLLAFTGMEDLTAVINANDPAEDDTYTDKDGNTETRYQLNIDQNAVLLVGKGGDAKFVAPPTGFSEDTKNALKSLFLLLLDHTGIPEFIWGNEMSSSRSSAEVQLTQWVRDIEARQKADEKWLLTLCELWLMTQQLIDGRVVVDDLKAEWPPLIEEDEETQLKRLEFAKQHALITDQTALELLHLVDDPMTEVANAQAEADARREQLFPNGDFGAQLSQAEREAEDEPGTV